MSDSWLVLIPADPLFTPDPGQLERARVRLAALLPDSHAVEAKILEQPVFYDCGENFERVCCPSCSSELSMSWWMDRMDEWFTTSRTEFVVHDLPCCGASYNLNELAYDWPAGFCSCFLEAMNPGVSELPASALTDLRGIIGTELRLILSYM